MPPSSEPVDRCASLGRVRARHRGGDAQRQPLSDLRQLAARPGGDRRFVHPAAPALRVQRRSRLGTRAALLQRSAGRGHAPAAAAAAAGGVHGQPSESLRHRRAARHRAGAGPLPRQAQPVPPAVLRLGAGRGGLRADRSHRPQPSQGGLPPRARGARRRGGDRDLPGGDAIPRRTHEALPPRRLPDGAQGEGADRSGRHPRHAAGAPQGPSHRRAGARRGRVRRPDRRAELRSAPDRRAGGEGGERRVQPGAAPRAEPEARWGRSRGRRLRRQRRPRRQSNAWQSADTLPFSALCQAR